MYVWTRGEIAEAFGVSVGTVSYWTKVWGSETDHPFPEPIAVLALPRKRHQQVFDPGAMQVWWADLSEAKHRRMSKAQTGVRRPRTAPTRATKMTVDESIRELEASMELLVETINELEVLRGQVLHG